MRSRNHLIILILTLGLLVARNKQSFSQTLRKAATFRTILDYQNNVVSDSFYYRVEPVNSEFIDSLYRIYPKDKSYSHTFLQEQVYIIYDGVNLFLNLKKLRMSRGFKKLENPRMYQFFDGRPSKPEGIAGGNVAMTFGLLAGIATAAADGINKELMTRERAWYILNRSTGQVYPLNSSTLDRILEPYSTLFDLYRIDPTREQFPTMIEYLDLLNGLIETEPK
jgi:hypothetical protein